MNTLTHKGYGRIYVEVPGDVERVKSIIEKLDSFEFDYLPEDLITIYTDYPKVVYVHKFSDMDMDKLTAKCWEVGIRIWVFDAGHNESPEK